MKLDRLIESLIVRRDGIMSDYNKQRSKITVMSNGASRAEVHGLGGRIDELQDIVDMLSVARDLGAEQ